MKRMLCLVIALLLVAMTFGACGTVSDVESQAPVESADSAADSGDAPASDAPEPAAPAAESDYSGQTYAFISFLSGEDHWRRCYIGFEAAGQYLGVNTVHIGETEDDLTAYLANVDAAINQGVDGIAVACYNADAYVDVINKAIAAGIPVVTYDSDAPESNRLSYMSTGNEDAGVFAADMMADVMDESGQVLILTRVGQENIETRVNGFKARIEEAYPGMSVASELNVSAEVADMTTKTAAALQANPEITGVFCSGGVMGIGVAQAVRELGRTGEVKILGFDLDMAQLELVKSGEMVGTIMQGTYNMGWWTCLGLFHEANGLLQGNPLPPYINTGVALVDQSNVDEIMNQ